MTMPYEIEWVPSGVVIEYSGVVLAGDIDDSNQALYEDARFGDCSYQIFNFDSADITKITLDHVGRTAVTDAQVSLQFPNFVVAIVTNQAMGDALVFHYKMLARTNHMKWEIERFDTVDEALKWCKSASS